MRLKCWIFLLVGSITTNAFAGTMGQFISDLFPSDGLMLENHVYKNAAIFENLGVYSGTVYATAIYENVSSYCEPGFFFSTDTSECVICDENHYCVGGENAVMESCPDGLISPTGTVVADNCGKLIRIGDGMLYLTQTQQTTPALAVRVDGKVYYAKTTPVSEGEKSMSANTEYSMRTKIDGIEYSIHDNTI